jgi:hypothetical protein
VGSYITKILPTEGVSVIIKKYITEDSQPFVK